MSGAINYRRLDLALHEPGKQLLTGAAPTPERFVAPVLKAAEGIVHGFFGRRGGVSIGLYASLNCGPGSDDLPRHVATNRSQTMAEIGMPAGTLRTLYQVHGKTVVRINGTEPKDFHPQADSMVTVTPGVALGILTADCVPVLLADPAARVIAAAHAGWKGARAGVIEATLDEMVVLGARRHQIIAAIGPAISADSYEVGQDFPALFLSNDPRSDKFFRPSPQSGHTYFDLVGFVTQSLKQAKIGVVEGIHLDTYADVDRFFSYRRSTHLGEPDYGRQLSVIAIPG